MKKLMFILVLSSISLMNARALNDDGLQLLENAQKRYKIAAQLNALVTPGGMKPGYMKPGYPQPLTKEEHEDRTKREFFANAVKKAQEEYLQEAQKYYGSR